MGSLLVVLFFRLPVFADWLTRRQYVINVIWRRTALKINSVEQIPDSGFHTKTVDSGIQTIVDSGSWPLDSGFRILLHGAILCCR